MKTLQANVAFTIRCPYLFAFDSEGNTQSYKARLQNRDIDKCTDPVSCTLVNIEKPNETYSQSSTGWTNDNTIVVFHFDQDALDVFEDREKVGLYVYKEVTTGSGSSAVTERKDVWWDDHAYRVHHNLIDKATTSEQ